MDVGMEIKGLKMDLMEELMSINDRQALTKIKSYINKIRKQERLNATTLQAFEEMKNGTVVRFSSFEEYLKAVENA